jgi:hypothetical protein
MATGFDLSLELLLDGTNGGANAVKPCAISVRP